MWTIGIDGGGTKCKAGIFDEKGLLLAETTTGPANLFVDFNAGINEIQKACDKLIKAVNQEQVESITFAECRLVAGCAGGNVPSVSRAFQAWSHAFASAKLCTDIHIASLAANQGEDCFLVIVGTGSCFANFQKNCIKQFGGHGFLLGDIASGAWLGKKAVSWFLLALENGHDDGVLFALLKQRLGTNVQSIIEQYGHGKSSQFAEIVPELISQQQNSSTIQSWLEEGAQYIASMITAHNHANLPIFFVGGLGKVYSTILSASGIDNIRQTMAEPIYGGYIYQKLVAK